MHALHDHDARRAVVPVHLGHREQRRALEVAPEQRRVGRLAHEVELVLQVARELRHHLARLEAPRLGPELEQPRRGLEQPHVLGDLPLDPGAQHLDRDLGAVLELGQVDLRDRGAGDRVAPEIREDSVHAGAEASLDLRHGKIGGERRHLVLQLGQLVGDVERQQVAARREHLPELDEDGAERLERPAQPLGPGRVAQRVEPEAQGDPGDRRKAQQAAH